MIPNKWSDFDFWSKMAKEYKEKFEYVLYMKKYGVDIYNIENLLNSIRVNARCAIAMDSKTKQVLFEQNADEIVPMANK